MGESKFIKFPLLCGSETLVNLIYVKDVEAKYLGEGETRISFVSLEGMKTEFVVESVIAKYVLIEWRKFSHE